MRVHRLTSPLWYNSVHLQSIVLAIPLAGVDTMRAAMWAYLTCMLFMSARHAPTPWRPNFLVEAVRAQVRSLATRSARFSAPLAASLSLVLVCVPCLAGEAAALQDQRPPPPTAGKIAALF